MNVPMDANFFVSASASTSVSAPHSHFAYALFGCCREHGTPRNGLQKARLSCPLLACPPGSSFNHTKAKVIVDDSNSVRFCCTRPLFPSLSKCRLHTIARNSLPISLFWGRKSGYRAKCASLRENHKDVLSTFELEKSVPRSKNPSNGIYVLLLLNLGMYIADHWLKIEGVKVLYLYHSSPCWYQFITALFCHLNWSHLSSNMFFMYIFGKLVEEEGGSFGLWMSYIICGIGANLVSWLFLPPSVVSIGASGAVFGLFAVSVLIRISLDWRKLLEVMILGQFVVEKVMEAARSSARMGGNFYASTAINHIAHFSGALVGVALIWALSRLAFGVPSKT